METAEINGSTGVPPGRELLARVLAVLRRHQGVELAGDPHAFVAGAQRRLRLPLRTLSGEPLLLDLAEEHDARGRRLTYRYGLLAPRGDGRTHYEGYHLHREPACGRIAHRTVRVDGRRAGWWEERGPRRLESALAALLAGFAARDAHAPEPPLRRLAGETGRAFRRRKLAAAARARLAPAA